MEWLFKDILSTDEKVLKVFKPDKTKFMSAAIFKYIFPAFLTFFFALAVFVSGSVLASFVVTLLFFAFTGGVYFVSLVRYNNSFYALTDRRVIVKCGMLGNNFKTLDLKSVGAVNVYTGFLDRLLGKGTGAVRFWSADTLTVDRQGSLCVSFEHLPNVYSAYLELKTYVAGK